MAHWHTIRCSREGNACFIKSSHVQYLRCCIKFLWVANNGIHQARRVDLEMGAWPMVPFSVSPFPGRPRCRPSQVPCQQVFLLSFAWLIALVSAEPLLCQRPNFFLSTNSRRKLFKKKKQEKKGNKVKSDNK